MGDTYQALYYPESRVGGFTDIDGTIAFYTRVNALLRRDSVALDFGCGRGALDDDPVPFRRNLRILKGKCARVCGVDVTPEAHENPFLDEAHCLAPYQDLPYADGHFDLLLADCVLEHLEWPGWFFAEAHRVLKHGGSLCLRTSNVWSYVGLAARLIPQAGHAAVLKRARPDRKEQDTFPAHYRANTLFTLRRRLTEAGFDALVYGHESEPRYLGFSGLTYALGVLHQRLAPGWLRPSLFAFAAKAGAPGGKPALG
jgi:SAM-dependent methyltransferase